MAKSDVEFTIGADGSGDARRCYLRPRGNPRQAPPARALEYKKNEPADKNDDVENDKHPQLERGAGVKPPLPLFALFYPFCKSSHVAAELSSHSCMITSKIIINKQKIYDMGRW